MTTDELVEKAVTAARPHLFNGRPDSEVGPAVRFARNEARGQFRTALTAIQSDLRARHYGEWQPIETAPKDGTRVIVTDGRLFTAAQWTFWEEPPLTSLGNGDPLTKIPLGGEEGFKTGRPWSIEQVPNPKAGIRKYYWSLDNPVAFLQEESQAPDYDGNFDDIQPTHWMPLPDTPISRGDPTPMEETKP